jgi:AbrB family looped-hinge helix DNA binding protein
MSISHLYTITVRSKGQITVPVALRRRLGLTQGVKVDIFALGREQFTAQVRRPPRIPDFTGDLKDFEPKT